MQNKILSVVGGFTGIEVFLILLLGQAGQILASNKEVSIRLVVGNFLSNIVVTIVIVNYGEIAGWQQQEVILVGAIVALLGVNLFVAFLKKKTGIK